MKEEARRINSAHSKGAKRTECRLNAIVVWFSVGEVDAVSMGIALGQRATETATTTKASCNETSSHSRGRAARKGDNRD
ncbi:hypothetical protein I7I50_04142 [Histoplasma capsulatum G186AR]|uniref:Uncharacterized protein n=1 Tax=Ajellomyces capsulatus TaxID=5037 RepID=A0A8H8CYS5_AJECA|nr:hypothetical protein I7I52_05050 [Histoplasma capsulatum]QSS75110.1 hypothetical protein I7I50_04142 [Histoplasma capsulatum G186AR]